MGGFTPPLLKDSVDPWGSRLKPLRAAPPSLAVRTGAGCSPRLLLHLRLRPHTIAVPCPRSASPWTETPSPPFPEHGLCQHRQQERYSRPRDPGMVAHSLGSVGGRVQHGPLTVPGHSASQAPGHSHQVTPRHRSPRGLWEKAGAVGVPTGWASPALSAWPLQDMTSPRTEQLGRRPTAWAGNALPAVQNHRTGNTNQDERSGSHGSGLCRGHPGWPAGWAGPLGPRGTLLGPEHRPTAAEAREEGGPLLSCQRSAKTDTPRGSQGSPPPTHSGCPGGGTRGGASWPEVPFPGHPGGFQGAHSEPGLVPPCCRGAEACVTAKQTGDSWSPILPGPQSCHRPQRQYACCTLPDPGPQDGCGPQEITTLPQLSH